MNEQVYEECDDSGESVSRNMSRPKWKTPTTPFQKRILAIFRGKYFPDTATAHRIKAIEKWMAPMTRGMIGRVNAMPKEWVEHTIGWVVEKRRTGSLIPLGTLLNEIEDTGKMDNWISRWANDHKTITVDEYATSARATLMQKVPTVTISATHKEGFDAIMEEINTCPSA